jgi:hypothetical protein
MAALIVKARMRRRFIASIIFAFNRPFKLWFRARDWQETGKRLARDPDMNAKKTKARACGAGFNALGKCVD